MTPVPDDTTTPHVDDTSSNAADYHVRSYQDELDTSPAKTDPVMSEETDDPVELLGVPADELADELDKRDLGDPRTTDDMREQIEDLDQDQGDATKY